MLSSTSNSNDRIPIADWRKVWFVGLTLFGVMLVTWEGFWRWQGFYREPSEHPTGQWVLKRKAASQEGKNAVVLIGSSRILTDIDLQVFYEMTGRMPIQLGVSGTSPIPVLQNLADDNSFQGTVLCDFNEVFVYTSEASEYGKVNLSPQELIQAYEGRTFLENLLPTELAMQGRKFLKETFVFQMRELSISNVIRHAVRGKLPQKPQAAQQIVKEGITIDLDNVQERDRDLLKKHFEELNMGFIRASAVSTENLPKIVHKVDQMIRRIQSRGGKVFLICLPLSGKLWEINEAYFPKNQYWDFLAEHTTATTIHFKDYAALANYSCFDDSHLSGTDVKRFTTSLVEILYDDKNWLSRGQK